MNELMIYVNAIKQVIDRDYGKECVFYTDGEWYSREHCRRITYNELIEFFHETTNRLFEVYENEYDL